MREVSGGQGASDIDSQVVFDRMHVDDVRPDQVINGLPSDSTA